ncbi:MAG: ABC transporter ATP-binding protein [Bacillota bacterium]|nr:ABC transporter ATP-binding protein [Bacillota bacterium]
MSDNNITNNIFELNGVSYAYPQSETILNGLSLEIKAGERLSILGANGCGKSTLLKILAGLIFTQSGTFTAFGNKIEHKSFLGKASTEYHRKVGYIFQDSDAQLFCSTVYEELAFGPLQLGIPKDTVKTRIEELSAMLGVERLLDKPPFRLSGGEKKKIAIGSVLILNPDVLILDEPTNSLDPRSQAWLLRLLKSLSETGKTLIFATHNLDLVPQVSDRAILFSEEHEIAADMPVKELLHDAALLKRVNLVDERYHTHPWDFDQ